MICFAGSSNITRLFSAVFLTAFDVYQGRYRLQTLGCIIREQSFYGYAIVVISFKQTIMFDSNQGNSFYKRKNLNNALISDLNVLPNLNIRNLT